MLSGIMAVFIVVPILSAQPGGLAVIPKIGTTGYGADIATSLSDNLNLRAGFSLYDITINYTTSGNDPDVKYTLDSENSAYSLLLDYHPFSFIGFRFTGGVIHQSPQFIGTGLPAEDYRDPQTGVTIPKEMMGSVEMDLRYESRLNPYLGVGLGNVFGKNRITLTLDAGLIFTGKPELDFRTNGKMSEVEDYEFDRVRDSVEKYRVLPKVTVGLSIRLL